MGVFRHRFHGNAADFIQRAAADHRAGAAEEGRIPHVVPVLHQSIKQRAFVRRFAKSPQVALKRVRGEEVVRRLHHRQLLLFQEPAHGHLQKRTGRHVVAVENRHELALGVLQRVVDIAGFRVLMGGARNVVHPDVFGELAELFAPAVVEDPDIKLVLRPVDPLRSVNGVFHHVEVFVIGRHENIDRRPLRHILRQRDRLTVQRPHDLEIAQHQHHPGVGFSKQQNYPAHQAHGVIPVERRGVAPPDVAAGDSQRQHDQHQGRKAPRNAPHQQRYAPQEQQENKLRERIKRLGNAEQREDQREKGYCAQNKPPYLRIQVPQLFMLIQMAGTGVDLFRQLFQPLGVAPLDAFQRRQGTPVNLFIRLRYPRRQQPHGLQQVANRVQRARPMRINMREKLAVTFADSLPARRFQRHKRPCQ